MDRERKRRGMISLQAESWKIRAAVEPELGLRTGMAWLDLFGLCLAWRACGSREFLESRMNECPADSDRPIQQVQWCNRACFRSDCDRTILTNHGTGNVGVDPDAPISQQS